MVPIAYVAKKKKNKKQKNNFRFIVSFVKTREVLEFTSRPIKLWLDTQETHWSITFRSRERSASL